MIGLLWDGAGKRVVQFLFKLGKHFLDFAAAVDLIHLLEREPVLLECFQPTRQNFSRRSVGRGSPFEKIA